MLWRGSKQAAVKMGKSQLDLNIEGGFQTIKNVSFRFHNIVSYISMKLGKLSSL